MAGRGTIALLALAMAACSQPQPASDPVDAAVAAMERGDPLGAEIALRRQLDRGTAREELAAYLGEAELLQGDLVAARAWLGGGQFSPGTRARGFRILGRLEMREGNLAAAGAAFDRALRIAPDDPRLWSDIGRLRYLGGEQAQAIAASERAVELAPRNAEALHLRGQLVRDAHGMEAALPWFEAALEVEPANVDLLADNAATLGELGRAPEMLAQVREMAGLAPRDPRVLLYQAVLAARAGEFGLARDLLARGGSARRIDAAARLTGAVVDLETGNPASAAQALDRLLREQPDNRRVRQLLVRALHLAGNNRELVYRFAAAARAEDADRYLVQTVGRAYEALGEREQAAPFLERAAAPMPDSPVLLASGRPGGPLALGEAPSGIETQAYIRAALAEGRTAQAMAAARSFLDRFPGSADARSLAGDVHLAAGRPREAVESYRAAAAIRRPWPLARRMLAAQAAIDDRAGAEWLLANQLASEPGNREALALAARLAFEDDWLDGAEALLRRALALGGAQDPGLLSLSARTAARAGRHEEARELAMRAFRLQRRHRGARAALAQVLRGDGAPAQAAVEALTSAP